MLKKKFPFTSLNPHVYGLEKAKNLEWLIPNSLGGYSSSTALGLNSKSSHGLLISGLRDFENMLFFQKTLDEVILGDKAVDVRGENSRYQTKFEYNYNSALYQYRVKGAYVTVNVSPAPGKNAVNISYSVENNTSGDILFRTRPCLNARRPKDKSEGRKGFRCTLFTDEIAGISSDGGYMAFKASGGGLTKEEKWLEEEGDVMYSPIFFETAVAEDSKQEFSITAVAYESEEETAAALKGIMADYLGPARMVSSSKGASILSLLNVAGGFVLDAGQKKTIVSGYPEPEENTREAMMALPGLTLINGRYRDAEKVLERFLNSGTAQGIPSGFMDGKPIYSDLDSSLWTIDRINQYLKYAGMRDAKGFLHTYWWLLKDIMAAYMETERSGILETCATWLGERRNAVEVQALWYDALRVMEHFAEIMGDDEKETYSKACMRTQDAFLEKYWTGRYLKDSEGDGSMRCSQLICLGLEYRLLDEEKEKKIMQEVEKRLLMPEGIRSLDPEDPDYDPNSCKDGGIWPHLMGSYVQAYMRLYDDRMTARKLLEALFERHVNSGALGTIPEVEYGLGPGGKMSYSCSVAEILRCYFEDIMGSSRIKKD